jgi:hypothetical protein
VSESLPIGAVKSPSQFAGVLQLLVEPPPSQERLAAVPELEVAKIQEKTTPDVSIARRAKSNGDIPILSPNQQGTRMSGIRPPQRRRLT